MICPHCGVFQEDHNWQHLAEDCLPKRLAAHAALIEKAVSVLQRHIVPDGLSDHDALSELYGIFDGPEYRAL